MGTVFTRAFLGIASGALVWLLVEPFAPGIQGFDGAPGQRFQMMLTLLLGAICGAVLGGYGGFRSGGKIHLYRGIGLGLVFGTFGIMIFLGLAGAIVNMIGIDPQRNPLVRIIALTPLGVGLGLGIGASSLEWMRTRQGIIGGFLGGLLGGILFDPIGSAFAPLSLALQGKTHGEIGQASRLVFCVLLGGGIGLFIGLVERLGQRAFLRQNLGRNEGKEWPVDLPNTTIGRSEAANVAIFGDTGIKPQHAAIIRNGPIYLLRAFDAVAVNGQPVTEIPLTHGAQIQMGATVLTFLMKDAQVPIQVMAPQAEAVVAYAGANPVPVNPYNAPMRPMPMQQPTQAQPVAYSQPTTAMAAQTTAMAPQATTAPSLVALDGPLVGQRFPLVAPMEVGRESGGIPLSFDSNVSRKHITLTPSAGGITFQDLGSTNGTFLNGQRVYQGFLAIGGTLRIGATTFRLDPQ